MVVTVTFTLEMPAIWEKAEAESPLRRYSATATARTSAVLRTRPRASRFKIVSWLSITWDIPAAPRAPLQARSHGRYRDVYETRAAGFSFRFHAWALGKLRLPFFTRNFLPTRYPEG